MKEKKRKNLLDLLHQQWEEDKIWYLAIMYD